MFHISKYPTGFQLTYRNFWPTLPDPWSFSQTCTVGKNGSGDSCPSHLDTHAPWICIIQSTCAFSKKNIFFSFSKGYRAVTTRARGVLPARRRSQTKLSLSPATGETYTPTAPGIHLCSLVKSLTPPQASPLLANKKSRRKTFKASFFSAATLPSFLLSKTFD